MKRWLIGKDPNAGKNWGLEDKGMTEDEMIGWCHWLSEHDFKQTPGGSEGQARLACCSPWGCRVRHDLVTKHQQHLRNIRQVVTGRRVRLYLLASLRVWKPWYHDITGEAGTVGLCSLPRGQRYGSFKAIWEVSLFAWMKWAIVLIFKQCCGWTVWWFRWLL